METPLASIIITNYNYECFLREAIDSALAQTYPRTEVVVVDDGSTDDSREVILGYGARVVSVLKANGGQASAFNAGFRASCGEVVLFLDADDRLYPDAVGEAVRCFDDPQLVKVQWLLQLVDEAGRNMDGTRPSVPPLDGDLRERILKHGPSSCPSSPTSGNAWRRGFLEEAMPAPEDVPYYRVCADEYLFNLAPLFGSVRSIPHALGEYRMHGGRRHSWFGRLKTAIDEINRLIPRSERFLLVDGSTWGAGEIFGDRALPVMEHGGQYWGDPPDTAILITELERQWLRGVRFLVLAWPAFWWFEHYEGMREALDRYSSCLWRDDLLVVYELGRRLEAVSGADADSREEGHWRRALKEPSLEGNVKSVFECLLKLNNIPQPKENESDELQFIRFCRDNLTSSHAQLFQDLFVRYHLREKKHGFFVEFGATDGISINNTYGLENYLGWTGILAEPATCWHKKLLANRSCTIDLRCVWSKTGDDIPFNQVTEFPELSTIDSYSGSDGHRGTRENKSTYHVQTVSINDLLKQHGAPRSIDYMSIDTEGSELDILKSLDFDAWEIGVITVEHNYTSNREEINKLLTSKRYKRKFASLSNWDDWYVKDLLLSGNHAGAQ